MATLVLDTFTGAAGLLSAHVGEVGATWEHDPNVDLWTGSSSPDFDSIRLNGSGDIWIDEGVVGGGSKGSVVASGSRGMNDDAPFIIEAELELTSNGGTQFSFGFLWGSSSDGYVLEVLFDDASNMWMRLRAPNIGGDLYSTGYFSFAPGTKTLRIEVTHTTKTVFLNGAQIFSVNESTNTTGFAWIGLDGYPGATPNKMTSYTVTTGIVPAESFWTTLVGTTEVFV
jgi:hypothetical protein